MILCIYTALDRHTNGFLELSFNDRTTRFAFRFEQRHGQPVAPSVPFPVFKSEGEPGIIFLIILLDKTISVR